MDILVKLKYYKLKLKIKVLLGLTLIILHANLEGAIGSWSCNTVSYVL